MQLKDFVIGIVGGGVVGSATAKSYSEHVKEVRIYDKEAIKSTHPLTAVLALDVDIIFICLPTPQSDDGLECNYSAIGEFFDLVKSMDPIYLNKTYVLKSTVPVGFTKSLCVAANVYRLVHSPEFLTARCAALDAHLPTRNIIGLTGSGFNAPDVRDLYGLRWPHTPIVLIDSDDSEAVKLMTNSFFGVKIAFWNEMYQFALQRGLDWEQILDVIRMDGRIHPSHTEVPGPDGRFGFGGFCLPKDLANLTDCLRKEKVETFMLDAARTRNKIDRERKPL